MTAVAMSHGELNRYDTLLRVERGELRVEDAATLLKLCRRQIFRCSVDCMAIHKPIYRDQQDATLRAGPELHGGSLGRSRSLQ